MKLLLENWRKYLDEAITITISKAKEMACPKPTQDLELNTKNRNAAIKAEHIQYGPLNLSDEKYWENQRSQRSQNALTVLRSTSLQE